MNLLPISKVIPESNIIFLCPHFDDFVLGMGGYILELKEKDLLDAKKFHVITIFSRSNYLAGTGPDNFDCSLDRTKLATGKRLLEDMECIDELLGEFNYHYQLIGEKECFLRSKDFADSEMEFPHGMYEDFNGEDIQIFIRMKERIKKLTMQADTALFFPLAFKEHIDHFIVREAAIEVLKELKDSAKASFYFFEDKPYCGIANEEEIDRVNKFIETHYLEPRPFKHHPEKLIELVFNHYISQVEEVYRKGVENRSAYLMEYYKAGHPCDQFYIYKKS